MRLGQLARKYNIKQDQVILFLNEVQAELSPFHHNSKVSNDMQDLVTNHFSISPKVPEVGTEETSEDISAETDEQELNSDIIEIDLDEKTEADLQQELDPILPTIQTKVIVKVDEKSIGTDRLLELLDTDEASNDLSKITHIKASKKELSGLKVVGKIELPSPKSKSVDKSDENPDKKPKPVAYNRRQGQALSDEEKNNRRLKVKDQKEQYEARQEKRRIAEEKKKKKAQNKAHYNKKMQQSTAVHTKQKIQKDKIEPELTAQLQAAKPIGIFDWFWKIFGL